MGHSTFSGNLAVYTYANRVITGVTNVSIRSGDIQDDRTIDSSFAIDQYGQDVSLEINQDGSSNIQIENQTIQFVPHCEILYSNINSGSRPLQHNGH
jgi:hypothetical protein